ncbi:MAG: flagellar motor protein PomA [Chromatiales bacterium]|nr:flagellar motor protein PomA [Chromatiales bacterium]
MDIATLIGLIGVVGVLLGAIFSGGSGIEPFVNIPSIMIVFGGSLMAILIKFPLGSVFGAFKVALRTFLGKFDQPEALIVESVGLADTARKQGILALDGVEMNNAFLKHGIQLLVDGNEDAIVKQVLTNDMDQMIERHEQGESIFRAIGDVAPAMGMIGTLVGLILMLGNMSDPKSIGPAMAVALLTTLYGAVIANAFALPMADKLAARNNQERIMKLVVIESVTAIRAGLNPRVMRELLNGYLPSNKRPSGDADG